jgi:hypothetical protein
VKRPVVETVACMFGALCCLFCGASGGDGLVLCMGDDGHMAVETSYNGVCVPAGGQPTASPAATMGKSLLALLTGGGCGRCLDISLGIDVATRQPLPAELAKVGKVIPLAVFPSPPLLGIERPSNWMARANLALPDRCDSGPLAAVLRI